MNDRDIVDTIAEVLRQAEVRPVVQSPSGRAAAVLSALRSAGYAVVKLPEPPLNVLIGGEPESVYVSDRLDELNITISGTVSIYADEAPALAAALLAAAEEGK